MPVSNEEKNEIYEKIGRLDGKLDEFKEGVTRRFDNVTKRFDNTDIKLTEIHTLLSDKISEKDLSFGFLKTTKGKIVCIIGSGGALTAITVALYEIIKQII